MKHKYESLDAKKAGARSHSSQMAQLGLFCLLLFGLTVLVTKFQLGLSAFQTNSETGRVTNSSEGSFKLNKKIDSALEEKLFGGQCELKNDDDKFDCYPGDGADQAKCEARGCCWAPRASSQVGQPPLNVPWCHYPKVYNGYKYVNMSETFNGVTAFLARETVSGYPKDAPLLQLQAWHQGNHRLRIKIWDPTVHRFEPHYPEIPVAPDNPPREPTYDLTLNKNGFGFAVTRKNGPLLFDAKQKGGFIFADQFLQLSATFQGTIYGLGQHQTHLALSTNWTRYVMFNHDQIPLENTNIYGSHPFYMVVAADGSSHGVFLHNSSPMEILLQPTPAVTFRSIGGVLDFYFLMGPSPADVVRQYTHLVGRPHMPPYWALGFHLCRFGYKDVDHVRQVLNRTRAALIPFDTQWNDIDYMDRHNDFTYDTVRYAGLPELVQELHDAGMHYVPILDPGVSAAEPNGTYPPYDDGVALDVLVKNEDGTVFVGKVWNDKSTAFPDFTNPKTSLYWTHLLRQLHTKIPFDGLWIDMNEPSNFLNGQANGCPDNELEHPPYVPAVDGGVLAYKTVCMSAQQHAGPHYHVHNLYGISEAVATNRALKEILGRRPFIISRSTFPGHGRYAGHWSGDVASTWTDMRFSIPHMLSFSLFGIPLTGADICGFNGNTTAQLCNRWSQLGAFYPFARNHNTDDAVDQDPVALGPEVVASAQMALDLRYTLLPYLYTLFYHAHVFGDTVARPLFIEFPQDNNTHTLDESFMWGPAILVVPVLEEYATTVTTYMPAGVWYDMHSWEGTWYKQGKQVTLPAPTNTIPVFLRGGCIVATQCSNQTTTASRKSNFKIIAAYNEEQTGSGSLFWDDGDGLHTIKDKAFGLVEFNITSTSLSSHVVQWNTTRAPPLSEVSIPGFPKPITTLLVNKTSHKFHWDAVKLVLLVKELKIDLSYPFTISWT